jgi:hypothetical protein
MPPTILTQPIATGATEGAGNVQAGAVHPSPSEGGNELREDASGAGADVPSASTRRKRSAGTRRRKAGEPAAQTEPPTLPAHD